MGKTPELNINHNVLKSTLCTTYRSWNQQMKADTICCWCNKQVHDREGITVVQYGVKTRVPVLYLRKHLYRNALKKHF